MGRNRWAVTFALVWGALASGSLAVNAQGPASKPLRVLFVGNSYTYRNDLPDMVRGLAAAAGTRALEAEHVTGGGLTLSDHARRAESIRRIREGKWDVVVLQEQSLRPLDDPASMLAAARQLNGEIRQSGARPLLFVTWARKAKPETQPALDLAYGRTAEAIGAELSPVGAAWQAALADPAGLRLYDGDGSHPSRLGTYLAACTLFASLYDRSPEGLPGKVFGVQESEIVAAQRAAWNVVKPLKDAQQAAAKKALEAKAAHEKRLREQSAGAAESGALPPDESSSAPRVGSARRSKPRIIEVNPSDPSATVTK